MNHPVPRIAVVGSINRDVVIRCAKLPQPGETVLADSSTEGAGGKGANQAVAASRLGGHVTMIGRVGDDECGAQLLSGLAREQLNTSWVLRTARCASGMAIVTVDQSGENSIVVVPGANAHVSREDIEQAADAIRSCTILLLQLEIRLEAVAAAIGIAREAGVRVILNPAPAVRQLPSDLLPVEVICPNRLEAAALVGRTIQSRSDAAEAAATLVQRGAKSAIVTMGSWGAVFSEGGQPQWCEPFRVAAIDSTAAGDAFAGALAVRLAEGAALRDAVQFACAAGALTATTPGAQSALPTRSRVDAFLHTNVQATTG